jgi:hypothetical protein
LPVGQHGHDIRMFIANRIIECVVGGARTQDAMARAALGAVKEIAGRPGYPRAKLPGDLSRS